MSIKLSASQKNKPIYTAQDVWNIIHPIHMRENKMRRQREYFWILGIDRERYLKVVELLAIGSDNRVHIKPACPAGRPADAFRMAIYKNTDYVIFVHNHPKGKLQPSAADKDTTDRLMKAGEIVDITVADHFIINEKGFFSFAEAKLMKQLRESSTYRVLHEDEVELLKVQMAAAGEAKGLAKGEEIGLKKGEEKKATEIAKRLLELGQSVELVMQATGLGKAVVGRLGKVSS
jgi:DNA repair protein RadC